LLYDMTKQLMEEMNVQFEYQVVHSLHDWVATGSVVPVAVQQQPLVTPGPVPPPTALPPTAPPPTAPPPTSLAPPTPLALPAPRQP
jgi:hypothetical protein